jgi:hypothetical protein
MVTAGCGSTKSDVPRAVTVTLPDGTEQRVTQGSGIITLADTQWDLYAVAGNAQSAPFITLRFGSSGKLTRFNNNTIAPDIFGSTIYFDGERHATRQSGLEYTAATYGAETEDSTGVAFEGRMTAFAAGFVEAARVIASASGTFDPDDPDVLRGEFSYSSRVTIASIPNGNQSDSFNFVAYRVTDDE